MYGANRMADREDVTFASLFLEALQVRSVDSIDTLSVCTLECLVQRAGLFCIGWGVLS